MVKNSTYGHKYKENMDNCLLNFLISSGYSRLCDSTQSPKKWYLPYFGVTNINNKPGKLRIVHDAGSRARVAVSVDIKEMFLKIRIRPEDRPAQRFLWSDFDTKCPIKEFEMKSVIFGATSSPAATIYIKNRNALLRNTQKLLKQ